MYWNILPSEYLPDAVVSSYQRTGENPWGEAVSSLSSVSQGIAHGLLGGLAGITVDGHQNEGRSGLHAITRFKEVDIISHPLASATAFGQGYVCESEATSLYPYFQSTLDAVSWRTGITELLYPATYLSGHRPLAVQHLGLVSIPA